MRSLLEHIPKGQANAVSMATLAAQIGVSERHLRQLILEERKTGAIIAICQDGYYQPETVAETKQYFRERFAAAMTTLSSLKAARQRLTESGVDISTLTGKEFTNGK